MNDKQSVFIERNLPHAVNAWKATGLNPVVILAQAALESGWGESRLAREHNNFFGLMGYGASNSHWDGKRTPVGKPPHTLFFRSYPSPGESFHDFARLIHSCYRQAWNVSKHIEAYAHEIAYSPYISERNGDSRQAYKESLISICRTIMKAVPTI